MHVVSREELCAIAVSVFRSCGFDNFKGGILSAFTLEMNC